jgi:hypothetical protein
VPCPSEVIVTYITPVGDIANALIPFTVPAILDVELKSTVTVVRWIVVVSVATY